MSTYVELILSGIAFILRYRSTVLRHKGIHRRISLPVCFVGRSVKGRNDEEEGEESKTGEVMNSSVNSDPKEVEEEDSMNEGGTNKATTRVKAESRRSRRGDQVAETGQRQLRRRVTRSCLGKGTSARDLYGYATHINARD